VNRCRAVAVLALVGALDLLWALTGRESPRRRGGRSKKGKTCVLPR